MPAVLREHQHELLTEDGAVSLVFGTEDTGYLTTLHPAFESTDGRNGDVERFREDGISFGEDFLGSKSMVFEIGVLTDREADPHRANSDYMNRIEGVWADEQLRNGAGRYAVLRSMMAGRLVRCYGRPRRFEESPGRLTRKGYTPMVCDFALSDGRWYDDDVNALPLSLVSPPEGGMTSPFTFPLTTTITGATPGELVVEGSRTTWPVVTFYGPVSAPETDFGPFVIGLTNAIPSGMSVTVDTRPWVRTVTRSDGANQAGKLSYATPPLRKCLLPLGAREVTYRGTDATGTSWCSVEWRNARSRP